MRFVSRRADRAACGLAAALVCGALALAPLPAWAGQAPGMPLVLPQACLSYLPQLNGNTGFTVVCLSQAPIANSSSTEPTAVVDLSPPAGSMSPAGAFPLFMFPKDVPAVQQLNGGMQINPVATFQIPSGGNSAPIPVEQVSVAGPVQAQSQAGPSGCLLVCPVPCLPLLGQLNPGLSFNVLCTSQTGTGNSGPTAQTAMLQIQPAQGTAGPSQPLPMLLPVDLLPTLGQLNNGTTMDIINVIEMPAGGSAALPVALVNVKQNGQPLSTPTASQSSTSNGNPPGKGDDGQGDGKGNGKGNGKGSGKGQGKGNSHGKGDQGDN